MTPAISRRRWSIRPGGVALIVAVTLGLVSACSGSDSRSSGAAPSPASAASAPSASAASASASSAPSASAPSAASTPSGSASSDDALAHYTDTGDGCSQAISAIGYADESLLPLGQEPYQNFDDLVRSKLAAVAGTLSLEAEDWPNAAIHRQAQVVQPLAQAAGAQAKAKDPARIRALLQYRIEAAKLIALCRYP